MRRSALVVVAGLLVLATSACDSGSDVDVKDDDVIEVSATAAACDDLLGPADPAGTFPANFPVIDGMTVYEKRLQGATAYYFAHVPGTDVVKVRDEAQKLIETVGKGYTNLEADAEPPAEAELSFEGTHEGSVQVIPLCAGHLRVRYKIVK